MLTRKHLIMMFGLVVILATGSLVIGTYFNERTQAAPQHTAQLAEAAPVQPFIKGSIAAIEASRKGRPFIVAFWSMGCSHCIHEMATWRKMLAAYPDFDLVMVSTDSIDRTDRIQTVLSREGLAGVESWAFADSLSARVRSDVDKRWRGELPRIHFYDQKGKRKVHIGVVPESGVRTWFEKSRA